MVKGSPAFFPARPLLLQILMAKPKEWASPKGCEGGGIRGEGWGRTGSGAGDQEEERGQELGREGQAIAPIHPRSAFKVPDRAFGKERPVLF